MSSIIQTESSQVTQVYYQMRPAGPISGRIAVALRLDCLARLACLCALALAPLRFRINLQPRAYPPVYRDYTDLLLFLSDIAILIGLSLWVGSLLLRPRRVSTGPTWLSLPLAGLTVFSLVSIMVSIDPVISIFQSLRLLALDGLYLLVIDQFLSLRPLAIASGIQVALQAGIGLAQVFRQSSVGLQMLGEHLLDPNQSGVSVVWSSLGRSLRAYGLTDHPNILGGCLVFGLLILAGCMIQERSKTSLILRVLEIGAFSLGCLALLLTFSRSAWLAWAAGLFFMVCVLLRAGFIDATRNLVRLIIISGLVCLPLIWQYRVYIIPRFDVQHVVNPQTNESRALNERRLLNTTAADIFAKNILTGVGLGVYPLTLKDAEPDFPIYYQPAHFAPLAAAAEIGIFGGISYLSASILPILFFVISLLRRPVRPINMRYIVTGSVLLALFIAGCFDYYTWMMVPGRLWQWVAWGMWASAYHDHLAGAVF